MKKLFSDVRGQKNAVSILSSQIESENLSHAYIFLGKNGVGKEFVGKKFAKTILCEKGGCGGCDTCKKFEKGVHPDFIYISGEEGIKIEEIRNLIERINLSPNISKKKVALLSQAENLGLEAANALLKTFEEPPKDTVIILTAVSEKSLPQTVISRGQKIKFGEMTDEEIKAALKGTFPEKEINEVLCYSAGSIGEAYRMLGDKDYLAEKRAIAEDVQKLLETDSVLDRFKMLETYEKNKKLKTFFDGFASNIFNTAQAKLNKVDNQKTIKEVGKKVLKIYSNLDYNVNLRTALEEIILKDLT